MTRKVTWSWREGKVSRSSDHFELRYGSAEDADWDQWHPVALVGRPRMGVFKVQFLIERNDKKPHRGASGTNLPV